MPPLHEIALVGILALTQALDWYSTRTILNRAGREQNPIARRLMELMGVDGFLCIKAVTVSAVGWFILPWPWLVALLIVFYAGVLAHNWKSL